MKLNVDPAVTLMRSLVPGEPISLRQAELALGLSDSASRRVLTELITACEPLAAPTGRLVLTEALDLYDPDRLMALLDASVSGRLGRASFHALCESTSVGSTAMNVARANTLNLALSDFQTGGRGRHGRTWSSGYAQGVCLTLAFRFSSDAQVAPSLTLAIGVAVASALDAYLTESVLIKWPNDLILGEGKLGGILVEVSSMERGDKLVRVGIGINCQAPEGDRLSGALPALAPAGLSARARRPLDRTAVAAAMVNAVVAAVDSHRAEGLAPFLAQWHQRDYLRHQAVQVFDDERVRHGTANGIDDHGALRVVTDEGELHLSSGEVRVRKR